MQHYSGFFLILAVLALASCKRPESAVSTEPPPQTFMVQGFLRAIDFAGRSVTVEHEDIPDYMPSMTMPFDVKTMSEVEPLSAGDAIEFKMIVTDKSSWIEGVRKIAATEIQLPAKRESNNPNLAKVTRLKEGDRLPDFQLIDSKGRPITRQSVEGQPLLLTFIFTRCPIPNFCPRMSNNFREIQDALAAVRDQPTSVQLLSISFDSEFDTPEVLAQYAARHTPDTDRWRFATGTSTEIKKLTQAFSISVQPENGAFAHGLATALVGSDGKIRHIWRGNGWKPAEVIEALRALPTERRKP